MERSGAAEGMLVRLHSVARKFFLASARRDGTLLAIPFGRDTIGADKGYKALRRDRREQLNCARARGVRDALGEAPSLRLVRRFQSSNHIKRRYRVYKTKYGRRGVG